MGLVLSEDETMLADAARGLLDRVAPVSAFRAMRDSAEPSRHQPGLVAKLAENGLVAPNIPEAFGGVALGAAAAGIIAEQAGHNLAAAPLLSAALAADLLVALGTPEQCASLLPALMAGEIVVASALDEASRHDPDVLATSAAVTDTGFVLDGTKTAVIDGFGADHLLVSARCAGTLRLFLVDPSAAGCSVERIDSIDSGNLAKIRLAGVAGEAVGTGDAASAVAHARDLGRALLAAELLGIADHAFDMTVGYLKERVQFGRKIGTFQALQHRAARLYARLDLARGVVLKALRALDEQDEAASLLCSLSKAVMSGLARDVLAEAVQMHGGIGVTDEFDLGLYYKRARVAGELLGDDRFHAERLAQLRWRL